MDLVHLKVGVESKRREASLAVRHGGRQCKEVTEELAGGALEYANLSGLLRR